MGNGTSSTVVISTGTLYGYILSRVFFTHGCSTNMGLKNAGDPTVGQNKEIILLVYGKRLTIEFLASTSHLTWPVSLTHRCKGGLTKTSFSGSWNKLDAPLHQWPNSIAVWSGNCTIQRTGSPDNENSTWGGGSPLPQLESRRKSRTRPDLAANPTRASF